MKKIILLACILCMALTENAIGEHLDKIVAVVNDDVVTQSELNRVLSILKAQFQEAHKSLPAASTLRKQALDDLINKKLELQIAKQAGITVTDADLDHVVENIASRNNMSVSDLYHRLQQEGLSTTDYRNEMREQMTVQRLQQQEAGSQQISVTADEIDHFMRTQPVQHHEPDKEFHLEDILIALPDGPSAEALAAANARARSVIAGLRQGQNVNDMAKTTTGEAQTLSSEDLGWRKLSEVPSAFAKEVIKMKSNEIAGPIHTANGLHIVRLVESRSSASTAAPSEDGAPSREQVQQLLLQRKFADQVQNWLSRMRSQAFISLK